MRLNHFFGALGVTALLASFAGGAGAQRTPPMAPGQPHTSRMGGFFGHMGKPGIGSGQIVGNKNTKVYHLPGDKGNMPQAKNAVYFRTEREAIAAGYHAAGTKKTGANGMSGMHRTPRHPMTGGTSRMPATGGRMNGTGGHLPK